MKDKYFKPNHGFSTKPIYSDESFSEVVEEYGTYIFRLAFTYVKNKNTAEDISQEVFLKAYKSIGHFQRNSSIKTWITKIAVNTCRDYLKLSWHKRVRIDSFYEKFMRARDEGTDIQLLEKERNDLILKTILSLPLKYREPILLYYYQEIPTADISEILNIPLTTVRSRMHRGRYLLKKALKKEGIVDE